MADDFRTLPHEPEPELPIGDVLPAINRYVIGQEIARGGMGAIHRATDTVLNRDIAIKVLQEQFPAGSPLARRFVEEAHITGLLQHPGIPPVYDLGTLPDGRPFLAMKLIQGQSLAEVLHKHAVAHASGPDSLLPIFEAICHAVGYAHSQGIIHRDLKPANVMVGAFGEVQVMDWGLARQLTSRERERPEKCASEPEASATDKPNDSDRTTNYTADLSTDERTRSGQALGTPAFMPPEQARGEVERIDARSDVFGLGAILCVILTGQPPFTARRGAEALEKAKRADLTDAVARLDACDADAELVSLCRRCLSAEPEARPAHGGEVAALVAEYRAQVEQRLRQAERDRAAAEAKAAEQRKKRRVQLALAGAVGLLLVGGAAFGWWADRIAGEKREAALRQESEEAARAAEEKARIARNTDSLEAALTRCEAALQRGDAKGAATAMMDFDRRLPDGGGEAFAARMAQCRADRPLLEALNEVDHYRLTPQGSSLPPLSEVVLRWNAALTANSLGVRNDATDELVRRIGQSKLRAQIMIALELWLIETRESKVRDVLSALDPDPFREALRAARQAGRGDVLAELAARPEAEQQPVYFTSVIARHPDFPLARRRELLKLAIRGQPGNVQLLLSLGTSYPTDDRGSAEERIRWFQAAVTADPSNTIAHNNLGTALASQGDLNGAIAAFREAIRLDPKNAAAHSNLGNVLSDTGDLDGAIAAFREAIRLDPKNAAAHSNLGVVLRDQGELDGAIAAFREAIRHDPKFATAHNNLGMALHGKGDLDGAIAAFREAIRHDPKFAAAHNNLGLALHGKGDLDGAIAAFREAIRHDPKFAEPHANLGAALYKSGDLDGAIIAFRKAIHLDPKLARAHYNLATVLDDQGDLDGAIVAYREAIRLEPQFKSAHNNLGIALAKSGDLDGAIRSFERAVELEPDNPQYKRGLALARMQKAERDAKATQVAPAAAGGEALAAGVSAFREP